MEGGGRRKDGEGHEGIVGGGREVGANRSWGIRELAERGCGHCHCTGSEFEAIHAVSSSVDKTGVDILEARQGWWHRLHVTRSGT